VRGHREVGRAAGQCAVDGRDALLVLAGGVAADLGDVLS
jgi:hypothetical protein